jgi:hypothetical protein
LTHPNIFTNGSNAKMVDAPGTTANCEIEKLHLAKK